MLHPVRTLRGDFAGYIDGDRYLKEVVGSRHLLRIPAPAWAFDAEMMDSYIIPFGVKYITVIDKEAQVCYTVNIDTFIKCRGVLDRGRGRQYFLILEHWAKGRNI